MPSLYFRTFFGFLLSLVFHRKQRIAFRIIAWLKFAYKEFWKCDHAIVNNRFHANFLFNCKHTITIELPPGVGISVSFHFRRVRQNFLQLFWQTVYYLQKASRHWFNNIWTLALFNIVLVLWLKVENALEARESNRPSHIRSEKFHY